MTDDFFCNRLDQMNDLRHSLAVLAIRIPWQEIEASLALSWARKVKAGKKIKHLDLFGATPGRYCERSEAIHGLPRPAASQ
jgi:IS5 family transposase